jgi:hypothetical protein
MAASEKDTARMSVAHRFLIDRGGERVVCGSGGMVVGAERDPRRLMQSTMTEDSYREENAVLIEFGFGGCHPVISARECARFSFLEVNFCRR